MEGSEGQELELEARLSALDREINALQELCEGLEGPIDRIGVPQRENEKVQSGTANKAVKEGYLTRFDDSLSALRHVRNRVEECAYQLQQAI